MSLGNSSKFDRAAFVDKLYVRHSVELLGYFARRTFDAQVAMDLTAETFATALEEQEKCRAHTSRSRRAWLYGIAHHRLADFYRDGATESRAARRLSVETPQLSDESIERVEQMADLASARRLIADAIEGLSGQHRDALQLRVIEERSYGDVAAELGVTEQTARARVSRALSNLREVLDGDRDVLKEAIEHV